jgi:hypothetical protein
MLSREYYDFARQAGMAHTLGSIAGVLAMLGKGRPNEAKARFSA